VAPLVLDFAAFQGVTFAVDDADATAHRAAPLDARVLAAPFDAAWVRMTVISDPQGAPFTSSRFVREN
jgi:predicted enzyme related to lactoylglutathione lyase